MAGVGPTPFMGGRERLGKALGSLWEGLLLPTHWVALNISCDSWQAGASPLGLLGRCQGAGLHCMPQFPPLNGENKSTYLIGLL